MTARIETRPWPREDTGNLHDWCDAEVPATLSAPIQCDHPATASSTVSSRHGIHPGGMSLRALQQRLLARELCWVHDRLLAECLARAADEALALAWTTPYPGLFLPGLLDEKCAEARQYCVREAQIRRISAAWLRWVIPAAGS